MVYIGTNVVLLLLQINFLRNLFKSESVQMWFLNNYSIEFYEILNTATSKRVSGHNEAWIFNFDPYSEINEVKGYNTKPILMKWGYKWNRDPNKREKVRVVGDLFNICSQLIPRGYLNVDLYRRDFSAITPPIFTKFCT